MRFRPATRVPRGTWTLVIFQISRANSPIDDCKPRMASPPAYRRLLALVGILALAAGVNRAMAAARVCQRPSNTLTYKSGPLEAAGMPVEAQLALLRRSTRSWSPGVPNLSAALISRLGERHQLHVRAPPASAAGNLPLQLRRSHWRSRLPSGTFADARFPFFLSAVQDALRCVTSKFIGQLGSLSCSRAAYPLAGQSRQHMGQLQHSRCLSDWLDCNESRLDLSVVQDQGLRVSLNFKVRGGLLEHARAVCVCVV